MRVIISLMVVIIVLVVRESYAVVVPPGGSYFTYVHNFWSYSEAVDGLLECYNAWKSSGVADLTFNANAIDEFGNKIVYTHALGGRPAVIGKVISCGQVSLSRNYVDQYLIGDIADMTANNVSLHPDYNPNMCIPQGHAECYAYLLDLICCPESSGYKAAWMDPESRQVFWTGTGVCNDGSYPELDSTRFSEISPLGSGDPNNPNPNPNPTPLFSPLPSPSPGLSPVPSPEASIPPPYPGPSPISTIPPEPVPTSSQPGIPLPDPSPNPTVDFPVPVVTDYPIVTDQGTGTSGGGGGGGSYIDSGIDKLEYVEDVPDKGQATEDDDTWLDTVFDLFKNHPLYSVLKNSKITTSGEVSSISFTVWNKTVEIGFDSVVTYLDSMGYFVFVCSMIYSYFIIFRVR